MARAQLSASSPAVVAAQERQAALLGKGKYRKAEHVSREGPVGSLSTQMMPKHKGNGGSRVQFQKRFGHWMRVALKAKARGVLPFGSVARLGSLLCGCAVQVKQTRTAAAYEKMVLRINAWLVWSRSTSRSREPLKKICAWANPSPITVARE